MSAAEVVYVRTKRGRIHTAAVVDGRLRVDESCNLDDARGEPERLTALPPDADEAALCRRCFPRPPEAAE